MHLLEMLYYCKRDRQESEYGKIATNLTHSSPLEIKKFFPLRHVYPSSVKKLEKCCQIVLLNETFSFHSARMIEWQKNSISTHTRNYFHGQQQCFLISKIFILIFNMLSVYVNISLFLENHLRLLKRTLSIRAGRKTKTQQKW